MGFILRATTRPTASSQSMTLTLEDSTACDGSRGRAGT